MIIKYYNQELECAKAVKGTDYIKLYDNNNTEIASFIGISNFNGFEIIGGDWSTPEPTEQEKINSKIAYLAMMGGYDELL